MNRQIVLHEESLDRIVELLRAESEETGNPAPDSIATTIEAQLGSNEEEAAPDDTAILEDREAISD